MGIHGVIATYPGRNEVTPLGSLDSVIPYGRGSRSIGWGIYVLLIK